MSAKPKIFVIDDDAAMLTLLERTLQMASYEVQISAEVLGTAQRIRQFDPDLVVIDHQMPALTGENLIRIIRRHPGGRPRIVMFSALPRQEMELRALDAGADAYVCKTDGMTELLSAVSRLLRN
ncbi:MAG: response regulator transcription factor [Deltaproteobacteria bacterium]|nr:response regulator transcription factor [Deltaproteobacteria bacterium]